MIEFDDFVKLYCIINARKFSNPDSCINNACVMARGLSKQGFFDSKSQVVPNDFLILLNGIKEAIEQKDCSVYVDTQEA